VGARAMAGTTDSCFGAYFQYYRSMELAFVYVTTTSGISHA
jgi:hypothetical protein